MPELLLVLVIVIIVFGAGKMPEIGTNLGRCIQNFKKATNGQSEEVTEAGRQGERSR